MRRDHAITTRALVALHILNMLRNTVQYAGGILAGLILLMAEPSMILGNGRFFL